MDILERARRLWHSGDLRGAEAAFREALIARSGDVEVCVGLAGVLADQDRFDAAIRVLDGMAPGADPEGAVTRTRADVLRRSGRVEQAIALLRGFVEREPLFPGAWQDLALDLVACGDPTEARRTLDRALEALPRDPHLWAARGMVSALSGRPAEAVEAFELATTCADGVPEGWRELLRTHLAQSLDMAGQTERAIAMYRDIIAGDRDARLAHVQLGVLLWRKERFLESRDVLRAAFERWPDEHDAVYYLADAERALGRRPEAERLLRGSVERWPECANCLFALAQVVHELERPEETALILRHVLVQRPDDPDALGLFAEARFDIGEPEAAREIFERVIRLAPGEVRHLYNYGLRERRVGRLEAATALFDRAISLAPGFDRAIYFATVCRVERGLYAEALPLLERFITAAPPSRAIVRADPLLDPVKSLSGYRDLVGGSLLDFAEPEAEGVRAALESIAADLPPRGERPSGATPADAVRRALASAVLARAARGATRGAPRFYFETARTAAALVISERDALSPDVRRPLVEIERRADGSYRAIDLAGEPSATTRSGVGNSRGSANGS